MFKKILQFIFVFMFVFSSTASAAEQFSFGGINLSFTPEQMMEKALTDLPDNYSSISSTIKPEKLDYVEAVNGFIPSNKENKNSKIHINSSDYPVRLVGISLMRETREWDAILKVFPLSNKDIISAEDNYRRFTANPLDFNALVRSAEHGFAVDYVTFKSKENNVTISIYYVSMPGFNQKPLYMIVQSSDKNSILQYVGDVFNERYGQGKVMQRSPGGHMSSTIWENPSEIAICSISPSVNSLKIINKEAYTAFVRFVVQELPKAEARLKTVEEAKKAAKVNEMKSKI